MNKYLTLFVFAILFYTTVQQTCTLAYQQKIKNDFSTFVNGLNQTNLNVTAFGKQFQQFISDAAVCYSDLQNLVTKRNIARTIKTDRCLFEKTTQKALFDKDPCCNTKLEQTQCCLKKSVNVTVETVNTFASAIDTRCANPTKAKRLLKGFINNYPRRYAECVNTAEEGIIRQFSLVEEVSQCFTDLYISPAACSSDSDCNQFSNGTCLPDTNKCSYGDVTNPNPLLDCAFSKLPVWVQRSFINKLGLTGSASKNTLRENFKNFVAPTLCVKPDGSIDETKTTSAACLAEKVCNVPNPQNKTCDGSGITARCFSNCNSINDVCTTTIPVGQVICASAGLCLGHGIMTKENCQNGTLKTCSNFAKCGNGCNQTACEATSHCLGAPNNDICVFPFQLSSSGDKKTCGAGQTRFRDFGCYTNGGTQSACETAGGRFIAKITTQAQCEAVKVCYNSKTRTKTLRPKSQCDACGLVEVNVFKWSSAVYGTPPFLQRQKVVTPAMVPKNKFIRSLQLKKLVQFFTTAIEFSLFPTYKTLAQCMFGPVFPVLETFACDCQSGRTHNTTNCYSAVTTAIVGSLQSFSGVEQEFKQFQFSLKVANNSITKDNLILLVKNQVQENIKTQSYYDKFNIFFENAAETGIVVSSGFQVATQDNSPLNAPVNICIERETETVVPTGYTTPAIATVDASGNVVNTNLKITNSDTTTEICADVSQSNVYYAAFFGNSATTSPGASPQASKGTSDSFKLNFTIVSIVLSFVISLFF
eukprot:gene5427-9240_t